jgi:predicted HicB family RNase H-like nuclease
MNDKMTINISKELHKRIHKLAIDKGIKIYELVEEILNKELDKKEVKK